MLSSDTLPPTRLPEQLEAYAQGGQAKGRTADRCDWRIVRSIFVAHNSRVAKDYAKLNASSPYRHHFDEFQQKFTRLNMLDMFKVDAAMADDEVTLDYAVDSCVIAGSAEEVVEQIVALRELVGPFGTLVYAGKDWSDADLPHRSMELMAERVMPAVNAAIGQEQWETVS